MEEQTNDETLLQLHCVVVVDVDVVNACYVTTEYAYTLIPALPEDTHKTSHIFVPLAHKSSPSYTFVFYRHRFCLFPHQLQVGLESTDLVDQSRHGFDLRRSRP